MPEVHQMLLELPSDVEKIEIDLATHRLAALNTVSTSNAEELVVCVPGFTGSKEDYLAILPPLSTAGYGVISFDQRGQYESKYSLDPGGFTLENLAKDVLSIAEKFKKPVHLIGHSMGGLVAQKSVFSNPEFFKSVTLLCSGPGAIPKDRQRNIAAIRKGFPQTPLEVAWQIIETEEKKSSPDKFTPEVWEFRKKRWMQNNPQALHETAVILQDTPDLTQNLAQVLAKKNLPALVLTGEHDDIWPIPMQQEMAKTLNADYVMVASAGHSPARERPMETAAALIDFFTKS